MRGYTPYPLNYCKDVQNMESFIIALNSVLPIFLMLALGYFLKQIKLIDETMITKVNKLVFKVFLPILLFKNVYTSQLKSVFNLKLILFAPIVVILLYLLSIPIICKLRKDNRRRGAMIQAIFRSNFVILGIPIISTIYNNEPSAVPALLTAIVVPLFNFLAVITLEVFRGEKPRISKILRSIITNPLILATLLGFAVNFSGLRLPEVICSTVSSIAAVASPLSIVLLGAFFKFDNIKHDMKDVLICTFGRLVAFPLIGSVLAVALGFRGVEFASLLIAFSAPPAISSFTMAQQMDSDYTIAGETVIVASALSCFTIFVWIFLYSSLGII